MENWDVLYMLIGKGTITFAIVSVMVLARVLSRRFLGMKVESKNFFVDIVDAVLAGIIFGIAVVLFGELWGFSIPPAS
jgi:uncharacterized membrane protein YedE/YeeE